MKRLLLFTGCVWTLAAQSWYDGAWAYRKTVVLDHRYVLAAQIGYVATVFVPNSFQSSAAGDADLAGKIQADCRDVVFTGPDGKAPLEYQIVPGTCDSTSGRLVAKVRIASLSASDDTVLIMYFGNSAAPIQSSTAVWDANYKGVWFGDSLKDATGNGNNLVVSAGALAAAPGRIATAFKFADATTKLATSTTIPGAAAFSLSAWIRGDRSPQKQMTSGFSQPITVGDNAYEFTWDAANGAGADARFGNMSPVLTNPSRTLMGKQFYLMAITCAGGTFSVYLDGALRSSGTVANCNAGNQALSVGGGQGTPFSGRVDEIEYAITARSKEYWYTKWLNEGHPEYFVTFGVLQTNQPKSPTVDVFTANYTGVEAGQPVVLRWVVSGSPASVSITPGPGVQTKLLAGSVAVIADATRTYTLTASNASGSTTKTLTISTLAAPVAYARSGAPAGSYIIGYSSSSGASVQMTVGDPLPVVPGDYVVHRGLASDNASQGYFSNVNGVFKVKQVIDSSHYTIVDKAGNEITANGNYHKGIWNPFNDAAIRYTPNGAAWTGKVTPYRFVEGPRGTLDGTNGQRTRTMALGTHNGLMSLIVSGGVATVTTAFDPATLNISSGMKLSIWGTTNSALNNGNSNTTDYTVSSVLSNGYQFAVSGVPNGDYTHNDRCGPSASNPNLIGGTENCVRISFFAIKSSAEFQQIRALLPTPSNYKYVFDGGTVPSGSPTAGLAWSAEMFMVDPTNQSYLDAMVYCLTHLERLAGVNFTVNEWSGNNPAGNLMSDINSTHETAADVAEVYQAGGRYLTEAQKKDATAKILNHRATSNADCNKVVPQAVVVATGTAQGGTANTIILAGNETKDFTNNYIYRNNGTDIYFALISNYDTGTKTATVSTIYNYGIVHVSSRPVLNPTTWSVPAAGEVYTIYATVTLNGTAVTGYNTRFGSYSVGDGLFAMIGDITTTYQVIPAAMPDIIDYISAISSDTSLTVIKGQRSETMGAAPKMLMYVPKWKPGDCGLTDLMHYGWGFGTQPIQRPPFGGYLTIGGGDGVTPSWGSNNKPIQARAYMALAAAMAEDDPVQAADIYGLGQNWWFDYELPYQWMFWTPVLNEGPNYSFGNSMMKGWYPLVLHKVLEGFPLPAVSSTYWTNYGLIKMFYAKPDRASGVLWNTSWGGDGSDNAISRVSAGSAHLMIADQGFVWQPFATTSAYLRNWTAANLDNGYWGNVGATRWMYYDLDPRIPSIDYTTQPLQYFFTNIERPVCSSTTGLDCGYLGHADTVISRTGWTDRQASLVTFHGRPYTGGYDCPQMGDLWLYKAGWLLGNDYAGSAGQCGPYATSTGLTTWESGFEFNGADSVTPVNGIGLTVVGSAITRWYSGNRGSWSQFYGDQSSKVAYAMVDLTDTYKPVYNRVWRHVAHFKSGSEVLVQFDDVDTSNQPTTGGIRSQVHFPQNGEAATSNAGTLVEYAEGSTVCQNCTGTNPTGYVLEQESGAPADSKGPARTNGLVASFFSPTSITLRWDGHNYSGARGHTERLSICAGGACGASATTLEAVHVYEVQASMGGATPTATALNPDANWTGATTADKSVLFSRGGQLRSAVPAFTAPAGQVLIAGLAAGAYDVTVGGTRVLTGTIVGDGDNALYFDSPGGTVSIVRTDIRVCSIRTALLPDGTVGTTYSGGLVTADCAAPVAWQVTTGALCAGLSLDSVSGMIAGVAAAAGSCSFTVQATDSAANLATRTLSITVAPPGAAVSRGVTIVR